MHFTAFITVSIIKQPLLIKLAHLFNIDILVLGRLFNIFFSLKDPSGEFFVCKPP